MSDEFNFAPTPRATAKKRKRSQTAPMIASIVTPAVVMIGFLVYLDQKGFFSPPVAPKVVAAKAEYKPQIDKGGGKHFPDPVRRVPPQVPQPIEEVPPRPRTFGGIAPPADAGQPGAELDHLLDRNTFS